MRSLSAEIIFFLLVFICFSKTSRAESFKIPNLKFKISSTDTPRTDEEKLLYQIEKKEEKAIKKIDKNCAHHVKKINKQVLKDRKKLEKYVEKNSQNSFAEDLSIYDPIAIGRNTVKNEKNKEAEIDPLNIPVTEEDKQKAQFYYARAKQKIDLEDVGSAINFLTKAIKAYPAYLDAYILRAECFGMQKNFIEALNDYTNILKIDSLSANFFYNRAVCEVQLGDHLSAIEDFTMAINLDEKYLLAYQGRATSRSYTSDQHGAIDDYSAVIDLNDYFIPAYKGRGVCMWLLADYHNAIQDFDFIINIDPGDAFAYYYRAISKISSGEMIDGCLDLEKSAQLGFDAAIRELEVSCN